MISPLHRRRFTQHAFSVLALGALGAPAAASASEASARAADAMIDFDSVYIPPLFLTGAAPKSTEGPGRAKAALARLQASWPVLRTRMQAAWPRDAGWRATLDAAQGHIAESAREAQLRKPMADQEAALTRVSQALRGDDAAALLDAAAATKPPFVRAYTAFGLALGDAPPR